MLRAGLGLYSSQRSCTDFTQAGLDAPPLDDEFDQGRAIESYRRCQKTIQPALNADKKNHRVDSRLITMPALTTLVECVWMRRPRNRAPSMVTRYQKRTNEAGPVGQRAAARPASR